MIDELRRYARILEVLPDQTRVFFVGFLRRSRGRLLRLHGRAEGQGDECRDSEDAGFHAEIVIPNPRSAIRDPQFTEPASASRRDIR